MIALVAALGEKQAFIVGRWGAPVAWHAAMFRPDIFTRVAGLSVPPPFRGRGRPLETAPKRHHQFLLAVFSAARNCRSQFERDVALTMRTVLAGRGFSIRRRISSSRKARASSMAAIPRGRCGVAPKPPCHLRGDLPKIRLPRRTELVPQHRSQLELTAAWQDAQIRQPSCSSPAPGRRHHLIGAKRIAGMERILTDLKAKSFSRAPDTGCSRARRGQRRSDRLLEELVQPAPAEKFARAARSIGA
jgi:non-specific protein-tyrosine kinase